MPLTAPSSAACSTRTAAVRLLLVAAALLGSLLAGASPASAHAVLTGSDPRQGSVVGSTPEEVTLTFSEGVAMSDDSIRVMDPQGKRVDTGKLRDLTRGRIVRFGAALHAGLPDGTFTVAWKGVSADSHPVSGAFTFSVGAPSKSTVGLPRQQAGDGLVATLYGIGRYVSYTGFVLLVGGSAFVLACWPRGASVRPVRRLILTGWLALTASTFTLLLLRHAFTGSGKLVDILDLSGLRAALETKPGAALVSRLLLLATAALFLAVLFGAYARRAAAAPGGRGDAGTLPADDDATGTDGSGSDAEREEKKEREERERKDLTFGLGTGGAVIAAGLAATWALAEHASTGIQPGVAMPVDVVHLLAVAGWLGGLAALLVALHRGPAIDRGAVQRFSRLAFAGVLVLTVTGVYQSWRQIGSWSALVSTSYGRLLLIKIGLILVLVGIAWFSRRWTARLSALPGRPDTREAVAEAVTGKSAAENVEERLQERVTVPDDPQRAAQLARQQAALTATREKKVRDADPERAGLRRSVFAEVAVAVLLLAVTTVLTSTEPARTAEAARSASGTAATGAQEPVSLTVPFDTGGSDGKGTARIDLTPGAVGENTLHIRLTKPDGKPLDVPEIRASLTLKSKELGPLPVRPMRIGTGHWSATGVQLPMAGNWRLAVTVRTSDIDQITEARNVKIG